MKAPTKGPSPTAESFWQWLSARRFVALWFVTLGTLLYGALFATDRIAHQLLTRDAERTAVQYADFIGKSVPGLDILFDRGVLNEDTRLELVRLRQLGDVFRFKLFDPAGRQLLVSDDLSIYEPLVTVEGVTLDTHSGNTHVREIVLGGRNYVKLEDGGEKADRPDLYSEAYVPLLENDITRGVIEVYVDQSHRASSIATAFAKVAFIVGGMLAISAVGVIWLAWHRNRDRRRGEAKVRYLAEHDVLSGALNRASFERLLLGSARHCEEGGPRFAIHCIDLDRFKEVNDTLGHSAGDIVLQEVAARLRSFLRPGDALARLGSDEFAILQSTFEIPEDVEHFGRHIVDLLAAPIETDDQRVPCGASVGAACYGLDADRIDELLHRADLAMYRSKLAGRGRFSFYDAELDRQLEDRRLLALDLRSALADHQLSLHYQPLFSASGEPEPTGFEALMRWEHPERGNVPPAVFISLAEETGQIERLGAWALERACQDACSWASPRSVAVNLSVEQFRPEADIVSQVSQVLERSGLAPERLELEITESLLMSDTEEAMSSLQALSALGVRIAMDDFGTGYSSLSYLWRFPFDKVKIDRAFVEGLDTDKRVTLIVSSIVSLAHSLGIKVNAEGVETESQRNRLKALGCDELQGFLLGRPAALDARGGPDLRNAA